MLATEDESPAQFAFQNFQLRIPINTNEGYTIKALNILLRIEYTL